MTESEVRKKLQSVRFIQYQLNAISTAVDKYRYIAEGLSSKSGVGGGRSDTRCNSTENSMMMLAETIERFEEQKKKLLHAVNSVSETISDLHDAELETILIHRYLLFHTVEQTAECLNYHPNSIKKKEKKAIQEICTKMYQNVL